MLKHRNTGGGKGFAVIPMLAMAAADGGGSRSGLVSIRVAFTILALLPALWLSPAGQQLFLSAPIVP